MKEFQPDLFSFTRPLPSPFLNGEKDEATAQDLRDAALEQVIDNAGIDWQQQAIACIRACWLGREGITEDFRHTCEHQGLRPHHPNAWGALTRTMKRHNMLQETGEWRSPKDHKSHARPTQVYRVL